MTFLGRISMRCEMRVWGVCLATERCVSPRRSRLMVIVDGGIPSLNIKSHNVIKLILWFYGKRKCCKRMLFGYAI